MLYAVQSTAGPELDFERTRWNRVLGPKAPSGETPCSPRGPLVVFCCPTREGRSGPTMPSRLGCYFGSQCVDHERCNRYDVPPEGCGRRHRGRAPGAGTTGLMPANPRGFLLYHSSHRLPAATSRPSIEARRVNHPLRRHEQTSSAVIIVDRPDTLYRRR